jgi:hypothetical protein
LALGEKAGEYMSGARDLTPPAAEVIRGNPEIALAEIAERMADPSLQPPTELRRANDKIADR